MVQEIKVLIIWSAPRPFYLIRGPNIFLGIIFSNTLNLRSFPQFEGPCFTPLKNKRQNYCFVYLHLYIFRYKPGRQEILHLITASIPWLQSTPNSSTKKCWFVRVVPIFKLFHALKEFVTLIYGVTFSCLLVSRLDHVLNFLIIYFCTNRITWD